MTGTNTGSMFGHKPSGKKVKIDGADIMRFENGKSVEHWGYMEETKFLHQLGMPQRNLSKHGADLCGLRYSGGLRNALHTLVKQASQVIRDYDC